MTPVHGKMKSLENAGERTPTSRLPSKKSDKKVKIIQEIVQEEAREHRGPRVSVEAIQNALDDQMEEIHGLCVLHLQKNKRMLEKLEQVEKIKDYEMQDLRTQMLSLTTPNKQLGQAKGSSLGTAQLESAKKLLVQRDAACRLAEQENFQLREQLAAMQVVGQQTSFLLNKATSPEAISAVALPPEQPPPPPHTDAVLFRLERAQTVLETWATNYHPRIRPPELIESDDEDYLPGAVPPPRKGDSKGPPEPEEEKEEEEPYDPKAEYLRQSQKQRKKKALNSKLRALDMKSRMRDAFAEPSYIATEHYHKTGCAQWIARSYWFEHTTMIVILLNSVWLGVDSTINRRALLIAADPSIIVIENLLCLAFTVEIIIRFLAFKSKCSAFKDFWFVFDFFLAFFMILETWVVSAVMSITGEELLLIDSSVLRMLRLLRLTRVARIARLLRFLPEVMILVRAIGAATRSVTLTVCLALIIVYVFAIALTQVAVDTPAGSQYYSSLPEAMFNLIFHGCFNNDLVQMARVSFQDDLIVASLFACFLLIAPLTVMNLLVGVLVEVVRVVATAEQEGRVVRNLKEELHYAKEALGSDDGTISQEELIMLLQNDQAIDVLQDVGIDLVALVKDPNIIFDGEPFMAFQDFLDEVLLLRGSNTATVKDLTVLKNQLITTLPSLLKRRMKTLI
ncbi:unnamed protein product [Effrenium voratum]|uniref:Ion transport domain-containing protein n=1 Tax=Effrenium voratum TaxID=2562239 RepID=A0AA36IZD0_9DINO|nr:unnamed protein product [Effrenium voratum]